MNAARVFTLKRDLSQSNFSPPSLAEKTDVRRFHGDLTLIERSVKQRGMGKWTREIRFERRVDTKRRSKQRRKAGRGWRIKRGRA